MTKGVEGRGETPDAGVEHVDEADLRAEFEQRQRDNYVGQLQREVETIEAKLAGMKQALASKRDELKAARAAAKEA